jgi:hypothetical protein
MDEKDLQRTTIVPDGDPNPVFGEPILKLVVLGDRPDLVEIADKLSIDPPFIPRKVIWFKNGLPDALQAKFNVPDLADVKAFSLSVTNSLGPSLMDNDIEDFAAVDNLFIQAGLIG